MAMKIALFTAPYLNYPLERAFQAAAKYGYDAIELSGARPHAYAPDVMNGGAAQILWWKNTTCLLWTMYLRILVVPTAWCSRTRR